MSINGVGYRNAYLNYSTLNIKRQMDTLLNQLSSGKVSDTYAGQGVDRGFAVSLRAQLSLYEAFASTATNVNTRISVANLSLQGVDDISTQLRAAANNTDLTVNIYGQTNGQVNARGAFEDALALLNTQAGGRYLFSGRATDTPPTVSADVIFNGDGAKAGLNQLINERRQADVGASGLGRVTIAMPTTTSITLSEDVPGSVFGMKLSGVNSNLSGATVIGPPTSPQPISIDFGTTNPQNGEKITIAFTLPDGTTENITLTATTDNPPPPNSFDIGADSAETAANFNDKLTEAVRDLANTKLVAASAMQASEEFFGSVPPMRVDGPPFDTATALRAGTPDDSVIWYTGEDSGDSARGTATVKVDNSISVSYGARANEDAIRLQLQTFAVYAAVTAPATDPNARGQLGALNDRVALALAPKTGSQSIQNIQADFAGAQLAVKAAGDRHTQAKAMAQSMLDKIEGVNQEEVVAKFLALQTSLTASFQVTSMLAQNTLTRYI